MQAGPVRTNVSYAANYDDTPYDVPQTFVFSKRWCIMLYIAALYTSASRKRTFVARHMGYHRSLPRMTRSSSLGLLAWLSGMRSVSVYTGATQCGILAA